MKMKTTRQQILDILATKEIATAEEISRVLHLTAANTRHHLGILREEGQIQVTGTRKPNGRGRPIQLYQLSQPRLEHNLDKLSHILLSIIQSNQDQTAWYETIHRITDSLVDVYAKDRDRKETKLTLSQRLSGCVKQLNSLHYKARWEAHTSGPRLMLGHCPYWAIISQHPELCQMDLELIKKLIGAPVEQSAKLDPNPQGLLVCIFHVKTTYPV